MQSFVESPLFLFQLLFSSFVVFVFFWHVKRRHPHHLRCSSRCHFGGAALVRIPRFWRLKASRGEIHNISNISIAFCTISAICFLPELRTNKLGRLPQDLNRSNTLRISSNLDTIYECILIIGSLSQIFGNAGRLDRISKAEGLASKSVAQCVPWLNFPENRLKQKSKTFQNSSKFYF